MKRVICLLISAVMLLSGLSAMAETAEVNAAHTIEKKNVPLVIDGEVFPGSGIPLYFLDGVEDLPYVDLKEFTDGLNTWFADSVTGFMWYEDEESGLGTITYMSNDSMLGFDFTDQSAYYTSFETFGAEPGRYLLDMLSFSGTNSDTGEPELFERVNVFPPERKGSMREIPLRDYGILMLRQDGLYLMPLHTVFELAAAEFRSLLETAGRGSRRGGHRGEGHDRFLPG